MTDRDAGCDDYFNMRVITINTTSPDISWNSPTRLSPQGRQGMDLFRDYVEPSQATEGRDHERPRVLAVEDGEQQIQEMISPSVMRGDFKKIRAARKAGAFNNSGRTIRFLAPNVEDEELLISIYLTPRNEEEEVQANKVGSAGNIGVDPSFTPPSQRRQPTANTGDDSGFQKSRRGPPLDAKSSIFGFRVCR
jgi:hypothetical protein